MPFRGLPRSTSSGRAGWAPVARRLRRSDRGSPLLLRRPPCPSRRAADRSGGRPLARARNARRAPPSRDVVCHLDAGNRDGTADIAAVGAQARGWPDRSQQSLRRPAGSRARRQSLARYGQLRRGDHYAASAATGTSRTCPQAGPSGAARRARRMPHNPRDRKRECDPRRRLGPIDCARRESDSGTATGDPRAVPPGLSRFPRPW